MEIRAVQAGQEGRRKMPVLPRSLEVKWFMMLTHTETSSLILRDPAWCSSAVCQPHQ